MWFTELFPLLYDLQSDNILISNFTSGLENQFEYFFL